MQQILLGLSFIITITLNILSSRYGYSNIFTGDKDILLPFSLTIFLFYPLLIYLPEAHYKVLTYGRDGASLEESEKNEEEMFPFAFLVALGAVTAAIVVHRLVLFTKVESEEEVLNRREMRRGEEGENRHLHTFKNIQYKIQSQILKYYLSLSIGLLNIVSSFYITLSQNPKTLRNELLIFTLFSVIINFAYGYTSGWSAVSKQLNDRLSNFLNFGIVLGYLLGLLVGNNWILLILPAFCSGLMLYCAALVGLPMLFSNGENQLQDKFRYGSIFTALLLTVVYHPLCYLLRV